MILDRTAAVARLTPTSADSDKENYVAVGNMGNIPINVQPASSEVIALSEGQYGQTYTAYTPVSGIYIGDQITVSGTLGRAATTYIVRGVNDWQQGPLPHLELVLFEVNV